MVSNVWGLMRGPRSAGAVDVMAGAPQATSVRARVNANFDGVRGWADIRQLV